MEGSGPSNPQGAIRLPKSSKYRLMINSRAKLAEFRARHNIPADVTLRELPVGQAPVATEAEIPIPVVAIVEGGVRFPLDRIFRKFLYMADLCTHQVSINTMRVVLGFSALNRLLGLDLGLPEILYC